MKKMLCVFLVIALMLSCNVQVFAEDGEYSFESVCPNCGTEIADFLISGESRDWGPILFRIECWGCFMYTLEFTCEEDVVALIREDGVMYEFDISEYMKGCFLYNLTGIPNGYTYYFYYDGFKLPEDTPSVIRGDPVPNAEYYQLYEKIGSQYMLITSREEINFDLSVITDEPGFQPGDHIFVVVACGEGFESSDYSNEVVYTVN